MVDAVRRRAVAGIALAIVAVLLTTGQARAQTVSAPQLQALAERAVDDPRALAQLRAVREVDGRPVDMGRALGGAQGPELAARLRTLAGGPVPAAAPGVVAAVAREDAADILEGRRFQPTRVPRPFAGILRTIGRWLEPVGDPVRDLWRAINRNLAAQLAAVAVVFTLALAITTRLVGRRSPQSVHRSRGIAGEDDGLDPDELERQATAAEREGDLDRAVRLRFVAGVLRLDEAGAISYRSSMTTGQLKAALHSGSFAELARAFDEIVYGGRPAQPADVAAATDVWPRVLAEARR